MGLGLGLGLGLALAIAARVRGRVRVTEAADAVGRGRVRVAEAAEAVDAGAEPAVKEGSADAGFESERTRALEPEPASPQDKQQQPNFMTLM